MARSVDSRKKKLHLSSLPYKLSSHPEILGLCQGSWWTSPSPARGGELPLPVLQPTPPALFMLGLLSTVTSLRQRNAQRPHRGLLAPRPPLPNLHLADSFLQASEHQRSQDHLSNPTPTPPSLFGSSTSCFFGGKQKPIPSCHSLSESFDSG